jgi:selenocysteine lyase/cysteine desulfurase
MTDWAAVRSLFPALRPDRAFLNTATFGQLSTRSVEAIAQHFAHRDELACGDFLSWFEDHDRLRAKLARLINATPEDIAFLPNACTGLGILMNGLPWSPGDEVLTLEGEFPNHIYAPAFYSSRGVNLIEKPWPDLLGAITPRTKLVAVSSVNYTTGFRIPLRELKAELHSRGILLYLDATQMLGAVRLDFQDCQPDLLTVNCYKWMLAPNGAAFMAVHPTLRDRLSPLTLGWRSHYDWRNVDNLHLGPPQLMQSAEKYEGGMLASSVLYALEASVDLMFELGPDTIERRVLDLAAQTRDQLRELGAEPLPYDDTAIIAARFPGHDASLLARQLKQRNVIVSARHGMLRVSTHFYNDESDLNGLTSALRQLL